MSIKHSKRVISPKEVLDIVDIQESWLIDKKGKDIKPSKLSRTISAFANTNGGDVYLGISHREEKEDYYWDGFDSEEEINPFIEVITQQFESYEDYSIDTYQSEADKHMFCIL